MKDNAVKWLWKVTGKNKLYIGLLTFVQALYGGSGVLYAFLLRNIVDCAVDGSREKFRLNVVLTLFLVMGQIFLRTVISFLNEWSCASLENLFKNRLVNNIMYKDFAEVSHVHSGEWLNRLTNDCMITASRFTEILPGLTGMIVKVISAAAMIMALDMRFAVIIFPTGIILFFLTYAFRKKLKRLHRTIQEKDGKLRIFLQEHLGSMMMIRSFAAEEQTQFQAQEKMQEHLDSRMQKNHFSNICNVGFHIAMDGLYLLGVCYCGYGIMYGRISYGTLTAMTQLISQIQSPFANITGYVPKFYAMTASAERLMEIEDFPDDCQNTTRSIDWIHNFYSNDFRSVCLENVSFIYNPVSESKETSMPVVLKNISLEIRKGEYVAFTGHSGCGKSTILRLIMCIYKLTGGRRFVTDNFGNSYALDSAWHRLFAYVPQGNQLMCGTVREIVAFADRSGINDDDRIFKALKIACADGFVSELENGIDTVLGERGSGLSEGQMQRIAVARAVFSESPVIVLDEATSAVDEATEKQLLQNFRSMTDRTVIIVTHRPMALEICDTVFSIDNGIVVGKRCGNGKRTVD